MFIDLAAAERAPGVGGKAARLGWLITHGAAVPDGFVVPPNVADGPDLRDAIAGRIDPAARYAVRSSADVEDGANASFAGQFTSVLDVTGIEAVVAAIREVRGSVARPGVEAYARRVDIDPTTIGMGVIVQRMATPVVSGVAFSKNPLTGLDEVVIEAVPGRGDQLVQDGTTPDRWVHRWGDLIERPTSPRTDEGLIVEVARETRRLATAFGRPADLEWVFDGSTLQWVQIRPIAGLDTIPIYSNRIAREVLPGIITPLVWSLNIPIVNRAWISLFTEAIGPNDLRPERLARAFGHRAYFDMGAIGDIFVALGMPRESLELLLGLPRGSEPPRFRPTRRTLRHVPRMLRLVRRLNRCDRRLERELPALETRLEKLAGADLAGASEADLVARVETLADLAERVAYANIVAPLLMNLYGSLIRRRATANGLDPTAIDPARDDPGVREHDPRAALSALGERFRSLPTEARAAVRERGMGGLSGLPEGEDLRREVEAFLVRFGHLSESGNDLAVPRWREDPDLVIRMILDAPPTSPSVTLAWGDVADRIGRLERPILRRLFHRAAIYRRLREEASSLYTFGYGLLRPTILELGRRLKDRDVLREGDDIFFLSFDEVRELVRSEVSAGPDDPAARIRDTVAARQAAFAGAAELDMPETIIGDDFVPRRRSAAGVRELTGVPSSRGTYEGPARVIRSSADFDRMTDGAVLVVPFSDVAWTPLFARAGAVVAESGGMLSHSSIVAREHGIPCVVSVARACDLPDGTLLHVDGYRGVISVTEP